MRKQFIVAEDKEGRITILSFDNKIVFDSQEEVIQRIGNRLGKFLIYSREVSDFQLDGQLITSAEESFY